MAVRWSEEAHVSRTAHGYSALPEDIVVLQDLSGRMDATDITDLARDIEANGQLELAVCWKNKSGFPVLAAGHRRYRAVAAINKNRGANQELLRLQFSFIAAESEQEAFDYTIRENRNRVNPSPLDDAHNMNVYAIRFGLGFEDIARKYYPKMETDEELAKAVKEVKDTLALLELSDEAKEEFRQGKFSTSAARQLASIPSREKQNEVIKTANDAGKKLKVDDVKAAKAEISGKPAKSISENSPSVLLKKYKAIVELSSSLAAEFLSEDPSAEVLMDLARNIIVRVRKTDSSMLPPGFDKKADQYEKDIEESAVLVNA